MTGQEKQEKVVLGVRVEVETVEALDALVEETNAKLAPGEAKVTRSDILRRIIAEKKSDKTEA